MSELSNFANCKRPLPPPESREAVLAEITAADSWTTVDEDETLQIWVPKKRARLGMASPLSSSRVQSHLYQNQYNMLNENSTNFGFDYKISRSPSSPDGITAKPKKSLFSSGVRLHRPQGTREHQAATDQDAGTAPSMVMSVNKMVPEEYLPRSSIQEVRSASKVIESDQEEALRLARITHFDTLFLNNFSSQAPTEVVLTTPKEVTENDSARENLEQAGQERSRLLREQALARRQCEDLNNQDISNPECEPDLVPEDSSEYVVDFPIVPNSPRVDSEQYAVPHEVSEQISDMRVAASPDIDTLFEIAKNAASDELNFQIQIPEKQVVPTTLNTDAHPASRRAAEQYRTQRRHLSEDGQNSLADSPRLHRDLEQGEKRLRMLTSKTFVPERTAVVTPKNGFLDYGSRDSQETISAPSTSSQLNPNTPEPELLSSSTFQPTILAGKGTDLSYEEPSLTGDILQRFEDIEVSGTERTTLLPIVPAATKPREIVPQVPPLRPKRSEQVSILPTIERKDGKDVPQASFNYPEKPELTLPKSFDKYSEAHQAIIVECETLKERERDLMIIIPTYERIAQLATLDILSDVHTKELVIVHDYTRAILDGSLSGKKMRKRVTEIKHNMERRVTKIEEEQNKPCDRSDWQAVVNKYVKQDRQENIRQSLADIHTRLEYLKLLRSETRDKRYTNKKGTRDTGNTSRKVKPIPKPKQVRFAFDETGQASQSLSDLPDGTEIDLPSLNDTNLCTITTTEKKRRAQYAAADRKETVLRARLALFSKSNDVGTGNDIEQSTAETQLPDEPSDISEEDEGAEYFSTPSIPQGQQKDKIDVVDSQLEEGEIVESEAHRKDYISPVFPVTAQAHDPDLASAMRNKNDLQAILAQQKVQKANIELKHINNESIQQLASLSQDAETVEEAEFDDLGNCSSEDEPLCFRYTLKAQYAGVPGYEEGHEYVHQRCLSSSIALKELKVIKQHFKGWYLDTLEAGKIPIIHEDIASEGDLGTRTIEVGQDGKASCRIWIEKEEYRPSHEAYQNAKVKRACHAKPVYTVLWERIVTPAASEVDNSESIPQINTDITAKKPNNTSSTPILGLGSYHEENDDDDDDLFGPEPPESSSETATATETPPTEPDPSPPPPKSSTTRIPFDALRFFTNIASANRHAKDVYMRWYMDHMRGSRNHGYIRQEEAAAEDELESLGDWTAWEREMDFDVYTDSDGEESDDSDGEGGGSGGGGPVRLPRRLIENDRFKIWVVMKGVRGPAN